MLRIACPPGPGEVFAAARVVPFVRTVRSSLLALLAGAALLPATAFAQASSKAKPPPKAASPRAQTAETLRTQCLLHAADPKNPWALAHGITGLGGSFAAADGRRAADVIVSDFLLRAPADAVLKGAAPLGFARATQDGTPVEPHANLLTKTLVHAGMKDAQTFKTPQGEVTLAQLVGSVQHGFRHVPEVEAYWIEVGWTLDLLASRMTPSRAKFKNGAGEEMDLNKVMDDALFYLERSQRELIDGMAKGLPEVPKNRKGIYAHPCGGLHLVQAVMHWARFPEVRKKWGKRLDQQVEVLFYRLGSEQRQYEAVLRDHPQHKLQILVQMMKFYGHFLETTGRMKRDKVVTFDRARLQQVRKAEALLDHAVGELEKMHAWARLGEVSKTQRQIGLDLIGDACHAANGMTLWR